ncbi:hypothetical protein DV736_g848, partial [Chaetothyriales sp. CBS 134916]
MPFCPSAHLPFCPSAHLLFCPSAHLPFYPSAHLPFSRTPPWTDDPLRLHCPSRVTLLSTQNLNNLSATTMQPPATPSEHCLALTHVSYTNFAISLLLFIGILVSYLPQHIRIIILRSSFGISPYFVLLGVTSGTCAFANILVLPTSRADMACCHEISGFACFAGLLGVAQVGMQWSCFGVILLLYLIFFPRSDTSTKAPHHADPAHPSFRTAVVVAIICVLHAVLVTILSCYFVLAHASGLQTWANVLGISATVLASIQYFPQIYTTYVLKRVGSLSIPMMCLQTPGSFVWAASLAVRLGPEGWSAWGVYCVTGCLQGTLLVMGIYYEVTNRRREKRDLQERMGLANGSAASAADVEAEVAVPPDEQTPLLATDVE